MTAPGSSCIVRLPGPRLRYCQLLFETKPRSNDRVLTKTEMAMGYRKTGAALMTLAIMLVAVALAPSHAGAQSARMGTTESARVYVTLEPALIVDVLEEAGFTATIESEVDGGGARDFVIIASQGDFVMGVNLRACDTAGNGRGCLGVNFFTLWDVRRGQLRDAREAMNLFNEETLYGRLQINEQDSSVFYSHYMIVDHGVTRDNIVANLSLFLSMCQIITDEYMEDILDLGTGSQQGK